MTKTEVGVEGIPPIYVIDKEAGDRRGGYTDLNRSVRIEDARGTVLMVFPAGQGDRALTWAHGYQAGKRGI